LQFWHAELVVAAKAVLKVPLKHGMQDKEAAAAKAEEKLPAAHAKHAEVLEAPIEVEKKPGLQP